MTTELGLELTNQVLATASTFMRESHRLFRPHGLTGAQYNVLALLAAHEGGISQRELSDLLVVDRSNVTGLLDRMEKAGWVRRADNPADRRAYRVLLTAAGRRMWDRARPGYHEAVRQVVGQLGEREARTVVEALWRLQEGAGRWHIADDGDDA